MDNIDCNNKYTTSECKNTKKNISNTQSKTKKRPSNTILIIQKDPSPEESSIKTLTPINPCIHIDKLKQQMKERRKEYDTGLQDCEDYKHKYFIDKYFTVHNSMLNDYWFRSF